MFGRISPYDPIGGSNSDMLGVPEFPVRVKNMLIAPDGIDFAQDVTSYNGQTSSVGTKTFMIFGNGPNSWRLANVGGAVGMVLPGYGTNVPFVLGASTGTNHNGIVFSSLSSFGWSSSTTAMGAVDTVVARGGVANVQFGANASATPVAQTLSVQHCSGTDIAGAEWTFTGSLATGNAVPGGFMWKMGNTSGAVSGSTQQTATQRMRLYAEDTSTTTLILGTESGLGTSCGSIRAKSNGEVRWNLHQYAFYLQSGATISWSPGSNAMAPDTWMVRDAAANIRFGNAASATPVAQTLSVQNASGSNISAAATWTLKGPLATGSGTAGKVIVAVDNNVNPGAAILHTAVNTFVVGWDGIGYATGCGGAVTQATSRTTGVTLDKPTGAITLFSAAGSATWQSFTVTNNTVAATDTINVSQKSGTDLYMIFVTAVAAGSFRISFATTGGTTTEQPVFNFAVIKAVAS